MDTTLNLTGKTALITGASRLVGIGAAVARMFAAAGADIAFTHWTRYDEEMYGSSSTEPERLSEELRKTGARVHIVEADLSDPATPARIFDDVEARLGPVSILVNNAAVSLHDDALTITAEGLDRHYAVNVRGTALMTAEFARRFAAGEGGRVINMTSGQGLHPMPNELSYVVTKGAIETLTTSSAPTLATRGITINAVDPGATDTGWMSDEQRVAFAAEMAFGRVGVPEDAARIILFLASDAGRWVTGEILRSRGV